MSMADVRHTKLSVLSTVLRDSHDTLTLGMREGDGEGGEGGEDDEGQVHGRNKEPITH